MEIVQLLCAFALYLCVGLALAWWIESRLRWWGAFDGLSTLQEWCLLIWWPLTLPVFVLIRSIRNGRR